MRHKHARFRALRTFLIPMARTRVYDHTRPGCPVEATLDLIGGKYKGMILYHLMEGSMRNGSFLRLMPDVTQRMLTLQLRHLEAAGLISRQVHATVPPRVDYALTPLGDTLRPALHLLQEWGERYLHGRFDQSDAADASARGTSASTHSAASDTTGSSRR
jgi:DNA-binding HxlR family transcriptional regulator